MVLATVCLHNYIISKELQKRPQERYLFFNESDTQLRSLGIRNIDEIIEDVSSRNLPNVYRERFAEYFCTEGAIQWQWEKATNNEF